MRSRHVATIAAALAHTAYAIADRIVDPFALHLIHDAARYDAWARAIVSGLAFETGAFSQAPLYPYLVAAVYAVTGPRPGAVVVLQVAMGVATVALVGRAAALAFDEVAAGWAAWLCAFCGVLAFYETKLLPAALAVVLVALMIERLQAADRAEWPGPWVVAGLVAGALALVNAASLLFLPLGIAWIASDHARSVAARAGRAAAFVVAATIVVAPVAVRNFRAGGGNVLVADNGGITFWQANNPAAVGVYSTPEGFSGSIATQRDESRRLASEAAGRPLRDDEVSSYWFARGRAFLAGDPAHAAWLLGRKLLLAVASTEQPLEYSPRLDGPWRYLLPVPFAALFALAVCGTGPARARRAAHPALIAIAATATVLLVFYVASRYRVPMIPGLAILAGAGAVRLKRGSAAPRAAFVAAAAFSMFWFPLTQTGLAREQDAMSLRDRATALRELGRGGEALATYARSLALDPAASYTHLDYAKALVRAGRTAEAESETREAIRLAPGIAEAHFDLGVIAFQSGRLDEAATAFAEAWRLAPGDAATGNNLAGTYLKLGRIGEARATLAAMRELGVAIDPPLSRALGE
jgi:tetratricopeptide (TPR) repeat protein